MERTAGLGFTANIRFHDKLLMDVVRLCATLRGKVPASTAVVCVLIPEGSIFRAASGLLDDPNCSAWLLADALGLARAADGGAQRRAVEALAQPAADGAPDARARRGV